LGEFKLKIISALLTCLTLATSAYAEQRFDFAVFEIPADGRIVVPVVEGETLSGIAATLDERTNGALTVAAAEASFIGEANATVTLLGVAPYSRIDLVGLGAETVTRATAEDFGGAAASLLAETEGGSVQILWDVENADPDATAARVAFGYVLRSYRFDKYQAEKVDPDTLPVVRLLSNDNSQASFEDDLVHLAAGVYFARDMPSEPANHVYPQAFVDRAKELFEGLDNIKIKVLDEEDLQRLGMGAHWGVGKGSARPPRLLIIEYMAGGDSPVKELRSTPVVSRLKAMTACGR
jgi:leucyl aminopeptidase